MQEKSINQLKSFKNPLKYAGLVITFFILVAVNCFGQSITWQKALVNSGISYFTSVVQTPDEGYIAAGRNATSFINDYMYIVRFNKFGDTLWSKEIEKEDAQCIIKSNDNNYVVCGRYGSFVKLDINGNILITGIFSNDNARILNVLQSNDSSYYMCGYLYSSGFFYPYLLKFNSNGNLMWDTIYSKGIFGGEFQDMVLTNDNNLVFTGYHYLQNGQPYYLFLMKTDLTGNQIWSNTVFTYNYLTPKSLIKTNVNSYIVACVSSSLVKFNSLGIFQWRKNYDTLMQSGVESITNTLDGNIAYTAYLDSGNYTFVRIRKTDTNGVEIFNKRLGFENHNHTPWDIKQTSDSGFVVVGRTDFQDEDAYILKTNKNAELPIGINIISTEIPGKFNLYQNYPNPFNPTATIKFDIAEYSSVTLRIYNSIGEEVATLIDKYLRPSTYTASFNNTNISSGIYFYRILVTVNNKVAYSNSKKFIIIK